MLGGGALNVPIFYFLWGLTYKESVVVSLSTLMGNYLCQVSSPSLSFYFSFFLSSKFSYFRLSYIFFLSPSHPALLDLDYLTNTHTHTHTHTYTHTHTHTYTRTHIHMHTHTRAHTRAHTHTHTHRY